MTEQSTTTPARQLVTAYQAAKILNAILVANGRDEVPAQLVYQYAGKGYIYTYAVDGKKYVDLNGTLDNPNNSKGDFGPWMVKYLARKGITMGPSNSEQMSDKMQDTFALLAAK